jgi:hypothetical protein
MSIDKAWRPVHLTAGLVLVALAAPCSAQTAAPGANPLSVTYPQAQPAPAGMVMLNDSEPDRYTLSPPRIHGFLTTGISTNGGNTLQGGVIVPVVPGRVDVQVSGGTGQAPVFVPNGNGWKTKTVKYTDYAAAVHVHATDNIDLTLGVTGLNARGPAYPAPLLGVP